MIPIDNQPISFRSDFETDSDCNKINNKTYCQLYEQGDYITAQWKAEICSDDVACHDTISDNLIANPTFEVNAAGWSLGTHWAWNSSAIKVTAATMANGNAVYALPITEDHFYLLKYSITTYGNGTVTPSVGGTNTNIKSAIGNYSEIINAGSVNELKFTPSSTANLMIDNVYLYDLGCFGGAIGTGIDIIDGLMCHIAGSSIALNFGTLVSGTYYKATVTVVNATQGTVAFIFGSDSFEFSGNGTFIHYETALSTNFLILMSADFDGCIENTTAEPYLSLDNWIIGLNDLNDNLAGLIHAGDGLSRLSFSDNFINLKWKPSEGDAYGNPISDGCYKICVIDACNTDNILSFKEGFDDDSLWTLESDLLISDSILEFSATVPENKTATLNDVNAISCIACNYNVRVNLTSDSVSNLATITVHLGSFSQLKAISAGDITAGHKDFIINVTNCTNPLALSLVFSNAIGGTTDLFVSSIVITPDYECTFTKITPDFCSNCISIKELHPCTTLITAFCNESSNGFNFDNFLLTLRARLLFVNPISKNRNENYKLSNNKYYKNFSERDKLFDIIFDYADEIFHDAINTMITCDTLNMVGGNIDAEYVWLEDSYKPEWDSEGRQNIAQSRIQIQQNGNSLTNSNCNG